MECTHTFKEDNRCTICGAKMWNMVIPDYHTVKHDTVEVKREDLEALREGIEETFHKGFLYDRINSICDKYLGGE